MENLLFYMSYGVSSLFELYIISKYMKLFLGEVIVSKNKFVAMYLIRLLVCTIQYVWIPNLIVNVITNIIAFF